VAPPGVRHGPSTPVLLALSDVIDVTLLVLAAPSGSAMMRLLQDGDKAAK
jgi:hypothetical protein